MSNNNVVYISNQAKQHDYSPAREHGILVAITSGNYAIFKTDRLREEIIGALTLSTPNDFLLLSGSSIIAGICMAVWLLQHETVNLLLYDRSARKYVKRSFSRNEAMIEIEQMRDRVAAHTPDQTD